MKAVKGNREYTITQPEQEGYRAQGFDILDDSGNVIAYAKNKTVPYEEYAKALEELETLKKSLTKDSTEENKQMLTELESMTVEELLRYAEENGINIGNATTKDGIIKKIRVVQGA